jgi:hypothetical protein
MKDCSKIHPLLSLDQEKALTSREKSRVKKHLVLCAEARKELKQFARLRRKLGSLPDPKMPENLHAKIMARLSGKVVPLSIWRRAWVFPSGAGVAAGLMVFFLFQQNPDIREKLTSPESSARTVAGPPVLASPEEKMAGASQPLPISEHNTGSGQASTAPAPQSMDSVAFLKQKDESAAEPFMADNSASAAHPMALLLKHEMKKQSAFEPRSSGSTSLESASAASNELQFQTEVPSAQTPATSNAKALDALQESFTPSVTLSSWSGDQDSLSQIPQQSLLADEDSFEKIWQALEPDKPVPPVDFNHQAVVFLEAGPEFATGYKIRISQLEENQDQLVIHWAETGPNTLMGQVLTFPWTLQVIEKPLKPVVFNQDP